MVTYLSTSGEIKTVSKADLQDQLGASEKLLKSLYGSILFVSVSA
jgi:hypothetical protein